MADFIKGSQQRTLLFGNQVVTTTAAPPNSGSSATLFTVSGGAVLVTSLIGRVTTALSGTTGAISLGSKPTVGSEKVAGISTATVVGGAEAGTLFTPLAASGLGGALVVSVLFAGNSPFVANPFVVNAGLIEISTTVATMTGSIQWYLTYVPLDTGASVA